MVCGGDQLRFGLAEHLRLQFSPQRRTDSLRVNGPMTNIPQQQIPGVYNRRVGDIVVTAISDGFLDGSMQVLRNITVDEATSILAASFRPARRTSVNAF